MLRTRVFALAAALALLLTLAGCSLLPSSSEEAPSTSSETADPNFPVTVGGAELTAPPETAVSLSPVLTELLCDLGYADRLSAVSDYCAAPALPNNIARVGTVTNLDIGAVQRLKPDVLFTSAPLSQSDAAALKKLGVPVVLLERAKTVDGLGPLYEDTGRAMEGEPAGAEVGSAFFAEQLSALEALRARVQAGPTPVACYLRLLPLTVATGDTFEHDLLTRAGFVNCAAEYTGWAYPEDKKADLMPDILFYDKAVDKEALAASDIYNTTPAWKNSQCYALDMDVLELQGARMLELLSAAVPETLKAAEAQSSASEQPTA